MSPTRTSPRISVVGVHVLDTHVIGVESIPSGSDGQLVETIRMSAAGTAGGTGLVLARLGAEVSSFGAVGDDMTAVTLLALLAEEDGPGGPTAYGFALVTLRPSVYADGPVAVLDELYVRPDRRGGGTGTALVAAMRAELSARDCEEVQINVDSVDTGARRFYERLGFVKSHVGFKKKLG